MNLRKLFGANRRSEDEDEPQSTVTEEVGSEGGSPGDLELERQRIPLRGSEATETAQSVERVREIRRDETGRGRRP
jgi:hypothetical protein